MAKEGKLVYTAKNGVSYDLDKASKSELAEYCWKAMTGDDSDSPHSNLDIGKTIIEKCKIVQENKEDIAVELMAYVSLVSGKETITNEDKEAMRLIVERYKVAK